MERSWIFTGLRQQKLENKSLLSSESHLYVLQVPDRYFSESSHDSSQPAGHRETYRILRPL